MQAKRKMLINHIIFVFNLILVSAKFDQTSDLDNSESDEPNVLEFYPSVDSIENDDDNVCPLFDVIITFHLQSF